MPAQGRWRENGVTPWGLQDREEGMRAWICCLVFVSVSFLLLPSEVFAQGDCLEVSAVDQRSLTQLRADVEEACPCDSFDGSVGAARSDYERCAGDVLAAALSAGDVRRTCRSQAETILEAATCGGGEVACGRIAPQSDRVFSCRIAREGACRGRSSGRSVLARRGPALGTSGRVQIRPPLSARTGGFAETVCPEQTHCADVVEWTAGTCFDVREDGPNDPGVVTLTLTKPSAVDGTPRELETVVWYPAPAGSGEVDLALGGVVDAPFDLSSGPRPVVLFSHGSCGFATQSLFLTAWLATHGFVVVAPPHPGNTVNEIATCSGNPDSATERPEDMLFVLDTMLAANADPSSLFFESLDEDAIAMSGHSFGGFTTFRVVARDPRIKVALPLMAATPPEGRFEIPSLTVISDADGTVNNEQSVDAYQRSARPKWLVNILHAGHFAGSGPCFSGPDCEQPLILSQFEANQRVKRWVLPFLKVFLEDDFAFAPFLAEEAGPGFAVEAK